LRLRTRAGGAGARRRARPARPTRELDTGESPSVDYPLSPSVRRKLYAARELVELRLLVAALDATATALRLEHPTVDTLAEPTEPTTLCAARHLLARIRSLRAAVRSYRAAVHRVLTEPDEDDLPF
jgi:hypothetical protein